MDKYVIFQIDGGIGKNVVATSVVRSISEKYSDRKIVIVTAHPDVWICNPRIYRVLQFGQISYFYEDFVEGKDSIIFIQDPYKQEDYIYNRKHLAEIWCDLCKVEFRSSKPELYFTNLEFEYLSSLLNKSNPIFLIQPFGGASNQKHKYSWARDIPTSIAQDIVNQMSKEYRVIQIRREDQIGLNNCEYLSMNPRYLALSILLSDRRLFIDSYMQHAAAAMDKSSTVLWICNSPNVLGYNIHTNISSNFEKGSIRNSIYDPFDIIGDPISLATIPSQLFDTNQIIESLN